ncbi:hypothetical protein, partial [Photobacterium sp. R1]
FLYKFCSFIGKDFLDMNLTHSLVVFTFVFPRCLFLIFSFLGRLSLKSGLFDFDLYEALYVLTDIPVFI